MFKNDSKRERGVLIDLYSDEKIIVIIRKHWFSFIGTIALTAALILVFIIASILFHGAVNGGQSGVATSNLITDNLGRGAYIVFGSIYLLSVLGFFYVSWLDYYLDVFILTNKRILRIEQLVLFGQKSSETSYQHVQAVSSKVGGLIQSLLHIGTVFVETAGDNDNFSFPIIRDPGGVATQILELQKNMWDEDDVRGDLSNDVKITKHIKKPDEIQESIKEANNVSKDLITNEKKQDNEQFFKENTRDIDDKINKSLGISEELFQEEKISDKECVEIDGNKFCQVGPVIEFKKPEEKNIQKEVKIEQVFIMESFYKDGRIITPNGVIWQSEQNLSQEILDTLNSMDRNNDMAELGEW